MIGSTATGPAQKRPRAREASQEPSSALTILANAAAGAANAAAGAASAAAGASSAAAGASSAAEKAKEQWDALQGKDNSGANTASAKNKLTTRELVMAKNAKTKSILYRRRSLAKKYNNSEILDLIKDAKKDINDAYKAYTKTPCQKTKRNFDNIVNKFIANGHGSRKEGEKKNRSEYISLLNKRLKARDKEEHQEEHQAILDDIKHVNDIWNDIDNGSIDKGKALTKLQEYLSKRPGSVFYKHEKKVSINAMITRKTKAEKKGKGKKRPRASDASAAGATEAKKQKTENPLDLASILNPAPNLELKSKVGSMEFLLN